MHHVGSFLASLSAHSKLQEAFFAPCEPLTPALSIRALACESQAVAEVLREVETEAGTLGVSYTLYLVGNGRMTRPSRMCSSHLLFHVFVPL